jgi:hypothetical protein
MEKTMNELEKWIDTYDIGGMTRTELMSKINTKITNARVEGYDSGFEDGQCEPDEDTVTEYMADRAAAMRDW